MIKEQSCPSCTMASTICDQSWGPSAPGTVHRAAKQLWCLPRPWKSESANPPERGFVLLWNPWQTMPLEYLSLGFTRWSQKLRKRGNQIPRPCSVFAFLSHVWHNSPSLTIRHHPLPPGARSDILMCVTVAQPDVGMYRGYKLQAATS